MNEIDYDKKTIYGIRYIVQGGPTRRCEIFMTEKGRDREIKYLREVAAGVTYAETFEFHFAADTIKKVKG